MELKVLRYLGFNIERYNNYNTIIFTKLIQKQKKTFIHLNNYKLCQFTLFISYLTFIIKQYIYILNIIKLQSILKKEEHCRIN